MYVKQFQKGKWQEINFDVKYKILSSIVRT